MTSVAPKPFTAQLSGVTPDSDPSEGQAALVVDATSPDYATGALILDSGVRDVDGAGCLVIEASA
jgi:hypothetical protein